MLSLSAIISSLCSTNTCCLHLLPFFQVFQVFLLHLSVLDSSGISRSAAAEIRPRSANTPVSALDSHAGSSSGSESRSMIDGKALHKTVSQPAVAGTKVEHQRKDHE